MNMTEHLHIPDINGSNMTEVNKVIQNITWTPRVSSENDSNITTEDMHLDIKSSAFLVYIFVVPSSCLSSFCSLVAIFTLYKCKKFSYQVKRLSYNMLISDVAFHVLFLVMSPVIALTGLSYAQTLFYSVAIAAVTLYLISTASVSTLSIDRLVATLKPFKYKTIMNKSAIDYLTADTWLIHAVVPIAFTFSSGYVCKWEINSLTCDQWSLLLPPGIIVASLYVLYHPIIVFSFVVTFRKIRHLRSRSTVLGSERRSAMDTICQNATYNSLRQLLVFELVNFPILANVLRLMFFPSPNKNRVIALVVYFCMCCNSHVNMYIYVWKNKECKNVFMRTFLFWWQRFNIQEDHTHQNIYNFDDGGVRWRGEMPLGAMLPVDAIRAEEDDGNEVAESEHHTIP